MTIPVGNQLFKSLLPFFNESHIYQKEIVQFELVYINLEFIAMISELPYRGIDAERF